MADFEDILNQSWDEIPTAKTLPDGSYRLRGRNASYQPAKSAEQNPSVLFVYTVKEPMDDVDADELKKLGGDYDFATNRIFFRMWVEDATDWDNVRKHLAKHGIETAGRAVNESLKAFKGTEVNAYLKQRTFTNNAGEQQIDNNPTQFAAVE